MGADVTILALDCGCRIAVSSRRGFCDASRCTVHKGEPLPVTLYRAIEEVARILGPILAKKVSP